MLQMLNYKVEGDGHTIILIHGLFGNLDNLGLLARDLRQDYQVISVDLRNHGQSFHSKVHTYETMAQDLLQLINSLNLNSYTLIGHSMGGKVAIKLAALDQRRVKQMIVLDMAPIAYNQRHHDNVFAGLKAVLSEKPIDRKQALAVLAQHIELEGVQQFLGKSLYNTEGYLTWRFNVESLWNNYSHIIGWNPITTIDTPTLFIKGGNSDYLITEHQSKIQQQFSQAKAHVIANTGHWLHAEKPVEVLRIIRKYLR